MCVYIYIYICAVTVNPSALEDKGMQGLGVYERTRPWVSWLIGFSSCVFIWALASQLGHFRDPTKY